MIPVNRAGSVTEMKLVFVHMATFSPLSEIPVGKTEISATETARSLIWTRRDFLKGSRDVLRSRKPGQPGQPGSYEEALIRGTRTALRFRSSSWNHVPGSCQVKVKKLLKLTWEKLCWTFIGRCLRAVVSRSFPEEEDSLILSGHWTSVFTNRTSNQCVHLLNSEGRLNCYFLWVCVNSEYLHRVC